MMHHSRAAALLISSYFDRPQDVLIDLTIPAATGFTVAATYTVGANILARLENTFIEITAGGAVGTSFVGIFINRIGVTPYINRLTNNAANSQSAPMVEDILLQAGDTVNIAYVNTGAVGLGTVASFSVREIDL